MSAISAPRSHRACISERVTSPSSLMASRRSSRARGERPGATVFTDHTNAGNGLAQSMRLALCLAWWSSAPNSAAMCAAFAVQPASLSSSA